MTRRGFTCDCGGEMRVSKTVRHPHVIVRYRKCVRCGKRQRTEERPRVANPPLVVLKK